MSAATFNLPGWVNWVAQDADGCWWGYSVEPHQHDRGWYENEVGDCLLLSREAPNAAWRTTLRQIDSDRQQNQSTFDEQRILRYRGVPPKSNLTSV